MMDIDKLISCLRAAKAINCMNLPFGYIAYIEIISKHLDDSGKDFIVMLYDEINAQEDDK